MKHGAPHDLVQPGTLRGFMQNDGQQRPDLFLLDVVVTAETAYVNGEDARELAEIVRVDMSLQYSPQYRVVRCNRRCRRSADRSVQYWTQRDSEGARNREPGTCPGLLRSLLLSSTRQEQG